MDLNSLTRVFHLPRTAKLGNVSFGPEASGPQTHPTSQRSPVSKSAMNNRNGHRRVSIIHIARARPGYPTSVFGPPEGICAADRFPQPLSDSSEQTGQAAINFLPTAGIT